MITIRRKPRPKPRRLTRLAQFSLGDRHIDMLIRIAQARGTSRSETLRQLIQTAYQETFHGDERS